MLRGKSISDYYRLVPAEIQKEVNRKPDEDLLGLDTADYGEFLYQKYSLSPVERDPDRDIQVEQVRNFDRQGRETVFAEVEYPIVMHPDVEEVLRLLPGASMPIVPQFKLRGSCLVRLIRLPAQQSQKGWREAAKKEVQQTLDNEEWWLNSRNEDIERFNPKLRQTIEQIIVSRKDHVARTRKDFSEMVRQVEIPLQLKSSAQASSVALPVRRELRPILKEPTPRRPEEYILKKKQVLAVVEFLHRWGKSLETTPQSVAGLEEEDLRALALAQLNGVVDGGATGEAFSKLGKTDIHLNMPQGNILIAECKIWRGSVYYAEAIDQVFRYLTWRQSYAIIIAFVRNKDFTNVLAKTQTTVKGHSTYKGGLQELGEAHLASQHIHPEDPLKSVEVHHLLFHFPTSG